MQNKRALAAYQQGGLEAEVNGATPHQLILLLMDGILAALAKARNATLEGQINERGIAISKAVAIFHEGLIGALNFQQGGELADNLDALYNYCTRRLQEAHQLGDIERIDEVEQLFRPIRDAWQAIGTQGSGQSVAPAAAVSARVSSV